MALSFLEDIGDVGSFAAGLGSLFRRQKQPEGYSELLSAARTSRDLSEQLSNPNDPRFIARVNEEEGRIRGDFAKAINDAITANRRNLARGGMGLMINQDRRDETAASAMADSFEKSRDAARQNVRGYLSAALQANGVAMGGFSNAARLGAGVDALNRANQNSGYDALFKGLKTLGKNPPGFVDSIFGGKALNGSDNLQPGGRAMGGGGFGGIDFSFPDIYTPRVS